MLYCVIFVQVNALLSSLEIDSDARVKGPMPGRHQELEGYWNESQAMPRPGPPAVDGWITEFNQQRAVQGDPDAWAHSFEQQHGANGWASEFERVCFFSVVYLCDTTKSSLCYFYLFVVC